MKGMQDKESIMAVRVDRKIRPSGSLSGITRQASWYQIVILGTDVSVCLSHPDRFL